MSVFVSDLIDAMREALDAGRDGLRNEWHAQGHTLTGQVSRTMTTEVITEGDNVRGVIMAEDYAVYIDAGVRADRIRYPIRVMIEYFKKRGLPQKEAVSAAWATKRTHEKEGLPTRGSYAFSKNGHRLGFIKRGIESALPRMQAIFENKLNQSVELRFERVFGQMTGVQTLTIGL